MMIQHLLYRHLAHDLLHVMFHVVVKRDQLLPELKGHFQRFAQGETRAELRLLPGQNLIGGKSKPLIFHRPGFHQFFQHGENSA